jgi:2-polyprenyl-3-methyl-5-hydroxy-6-metoxy-1,4-benzoquinol methylase
MDTDRLEDVKPYYKNPRPDVMPFVPRGVNRVLDVGCGAGAFGEAIREELGATVWGIEIVPEMAQLASERLDRVFVGDAIERFAEIPDAAFDLVTFNDALEHMADPWAVLVATRRLLAPEGRVLASLPNIRYWDALLEITRNADFPYQDFGIFDRTHLRFFTHKSMRRLFEESGYVVERQEGINPTPSRKLRMLNLLTRGRHDDCRFLQFVLLARPK